MMNHSVIMGRITHDLQLRTTTTGTSVLQFTVAVDRSYTKKGEERQADFISCVAWQQTAKFISRYFGKGRLIALEGELRTRTYDDKNGSKHYVTELYVTKVSFTGEPFARGEQTIPEDELPPIPEELEIASLGDFEEAYK